MYLVLVKRYGDTYGLRDPGTPRAIEPALYRPQNGYYEDVIKQAAALRESMTNNHAFVDGNKWIGFACTDTFLRINS